MEHVTLKHINGTGLHLDEVWDVDITMTTRFRPVVLGIHRAITLLGCTWDWNKRQ
jgi:hypothetical protein